MVLQRWRASARWVLSLGALSVLMGCYTYVPSNVGVAPRGTTVRAQLRGDPVFEVGDRRVRDVAAVEGEVIAWEPDTLAVSALELRTDGGESVDGGGYTVRLALADVTNVGVKKLDKTRTALTIVGITAAALLGARGLTSAFSSHGSGPNGGSAK